MIMFQISIWMEVHNVIYLFTNWPDPSCFTITYWFASHYSCGSITTSVDGPTVSMQITQYCYAFVIVCHICSLSINIIFPSQLRVAQPVSCSWDCCQTRIGTWWIRASSCSQPYSSVRPLARAFVDGMCDSKSVSMYTLFIFSSS